MQVPEALEELEEPPVQDRASRQVEPNREPELLVGSVPGKGQPQVATVTVLRLERQQPAPELEEKPEREERPELVHRQEPCMAQGESANWE